MSKQNPSAFSTLLSLVSPVITHGANIVSLNCLTQPDQSLNEDRYIVDEWMMPNGSWTYAAIFDGHAGPEAADFVLKELSPILKTSLTSELDQAPQASLDDIVIARVLEQAIVMVDSLIKDGVMSLLPTNIGSVPIDDDVILTFKAHATIDGHPRMEILQGMSGTTAIVALIDPSSAVHIASVGDCDAFICTCTPDGNWRSQVLGASHRFGSNTLDIERIRAEHPNEEKCVVVNDAGTVARVLGMINLSHALGDVCFKLPARCNQVLQSIVSVNPCLIDDNLTPPYISNTPEVKHAHLTSSSGRKYLILSSDGLVDLFKVANAISDPADIASVCAAVASSAYDKGLNMAVQILWQAFGGDSKDNLLERAITRTLERGRVDDITIIVIPLGGNVV